MTLLAVAQEENHETLLPNLQSLIVENVGIFIR